MKKIIQITVAFWVFTIQILTQNQIYAQKLGVFENLKTQKGSTVNNQKQGEWKSYFETGNVYSSGNYLNNMKTQKWTFFYENGKIEAEGIYKNNLKDSIWNFYNKEGKLFASGNFDRDTMNGIWNFYYPNGKIITSIEYIKGTGGNLSKLGIPISGRNGKVIAFYDNGDTLEIQHWKNDKLHGIHQKFEKENKLVFTAMMSENKINGIKKEWSKNGDLKIESKYLNDKIYEQKYYYEKGILSSEDYYDTTLVLNSSFRKHLSKKYAFDQSLISTDTFNYQTNRAQNIHYFQKTNTKRLEVNYLLNHNGNSLMDSISLEWNEKGQLIEKRNYKNGSLEGESINWYPNGKMKILSNYKEYQLNGKYVEWTIDGIKCAEGEFVNGAKNGRWKTWDYKGKIASEGEFEFGKKTGKWISTNLEGSKDFEFKIAPTFIYEENYDSTGKLNGSYKSFDTLGNKLVEGQYANDWRIGNWKEWYPNGTLKSEYTYWIDPLDNQNSIPHEKFINAWDSLGNQIVIDGNGHLKMYYTGITLEGDYVNGLRNGPWFEYYNQILISSCLIYKDGNLMETFDPMVEYSSFFGDFENAKNEFRKKFNRNLNELNWKKLHSNDEYAIVQEKYSSKINSNDSIQLNWINFNDLGQLNLEVYNFNKSLVFNQLKFGYEDFQKFQKENKITLDLFNFDQLVVLKFPVKSAPNFIKDYLDPAISNYYFIFEIKKN